MDLWDQTVTLYRNAQGQICRRVVEGCFLEWHLEQRTDRWGSRQETPFLLVLPGEQDVRPGDRVFQGEGPEITPEQWPEFLPVRVPGLVQVAYVRPCRWNDRICHTEAGRK